MIYDLTDEVKAIGSLNFEGNIIPLEWFTQIRLPNNKPDLISIFLLSDIIYWYRPTTIRDEISGNIVGYRKKFKSDLLQKGYKDLENLFGFTRNQIKDSFQRLEKLNLIKRVFRNINSQGSSISNVMFIQIFTANIERITVKKPYTSVEINPHTYGDISSQPQINIPTHLGINHHTYTETTTKNTTKNTLSPASNISKEFEREKEMISIWDKIIRVGDKPSVSNKTRLTALRKVLEESFEANLANWKTYCLNISKSNFLMGGGANNWKADITWATKQDNLIRVQEGYYHQKEEKSLEINNSEVNSDEEIPSKDPTWNNVKNRLKIKKGEATYKSWFKKLSFSGYNDDIIYLIAPSKFIKDWILDNFKKDIIDLFKETKIHISDIEILIEKEKKI